MLFEIYVVVFDFVQISIITRKTSYSNEMSLFCYIARCFSCGPHCVSFTLQLIWENAIFVNVVAGVFTLSFVPRIVLTKLQQLYNSLVSNLTTLVLWKNIVFENREWHCYYSTFIIALSVFITICIFLDCYNVHKPSNKILHPWKTNFSPNKKMHINVE